MHSLRRRKLAARRPGRALRRAPRDPGFLEARRDRLGRSDSRARGAAMWLAPRRVRRGRARSALGIGGVRRGRRRQRWCWRGVGGRGGGPSGVWRFSGWGLTGGGRWGSGGGG